MQGGYGPASSLRFNAITDGIEDYEYLTIAQKVLGEAKTDEIINSVTTSLTEYITDDTLFCEIRVRLGNEIQNAV